MACHPPKKQGGSLAWLNTGPGQQPSATAAQKLCPHKVGAWQEVTVLQRTKWDQALLALNKSIPITQPNSYAHFWC